MQMDAIDVGAGAQDAPAVSGIDGIILYNGPGQRAQYEGLQPGVEFRVGFV